ncbi:MAG: RagB/SusD family nutrient uptake outer membrane protein, partial [Bacteroidales bacterium]
MKKYILGACVSSLILSSCELNTFPEGGTITEDQKQEVIDGDPSLLSAEVNALYSDMIIYNIMQGSGISHFDFGYASACIMWESTGQDMVSPNTGYNWYSPNLLFTDRVYNSTRTEFLWKTFYKQIRSANSILLALPKDKLTNQTSKNFRGQALAARAFDYLQLIQMLQFTYIGHEDAPGVPLVTEDKTFEQLKNNPRAKVKDVYDLIISDLNEAIELLTTERPSKDVININVAYGLRARAN